jgi:asparagine synthetase B (glutamine-hydrolysing)
MPGLAVILGQPGQNGLGDALGRMLAAVTFAGRATSCVVIPELGIAAGRTGPASTGAEGMASGDPKIGRAAGGQIVALVEGEPLALSSSSAGLGLGAAASPAEIIAALYVARGAASLETIRGHWAVALVDRSQAQVIIANDAFGIRPLFRMRAGDGEWLIATHPAALLAYPGVKRAVDPAGLADTLAFGYPLGDKTLFCGMERLPAATMLRWANAGMQERRYWTPVMRPDRHWSEADLEEIRCGFNQSVLDMAAEGGPASLALSGGGDSRAILSALVAGGLRLDTVTHAVAEASDAQLSMELARLVGANHHFFKVGGEDVAPHVIEGVRMVAGQVAGMEVHALSFLPEYPSFTRAMLTGLGGNVYKGSYLFGEQHRPGISLPGLANWLLDKHNSYMHVDTDLQPLLTSDWYAALRDLPARSVAETLGRMSADTPFWQRSIVFYLEERVCKYLVKGDSLVRREIEARHPFMDRQLLLRSWRVPSAARARGIIPSYIITRNAPQLLDVRATWGLNSGLPLRRYSSTSLGRCMSYVSQVRQNRQERQRAHSWMVPNYRYADWLRGAVRPLLEDVLFDPRTQARPYFRQDTVRRWVAEHMAGQDHARKLSTLLALELTLRAFVDGDDPAG